MLGNGRLEAMCFDGVKRLCHIRGKLRKKVWINQSDIVLVSCYYLTIISIRTVTAGIPLIQFTVSTSP